MVPGVARGAGPNRVLCVVAVLGVLGSTRVARSAGASRGAWGYN